MDALEVLENRYALNVNSKLVANISAPVTRCVVVKRPEHAAAVQHRRELSEIRSGAEHKLQQQKNREKPRRPDQLWPMRMKLHNPNQNKDDMQGYQQSKK